MRVAAAPLEVELKPHRLDFTADGPEYLIVAQRAFTSHREPKSNAQA